MAREIFDFVLTFVEYKYILISEIKKTQIKQSEVIKMKRTFKSFDEYSEYYDNHEHRMNDVDIVEDTLTVGADGEFECKSWKTAIRRFFKALAGDDRFDWEESIIEWIKEGVWKDRAEYNGKYIIGGYHWEVENIDENCWYIELTVGK